MFTSARTLTDQQYTHTHTHTLRDSSDAWPWRLPIYVQTKGQSYYHNTRTQPCSSVCQWLPATA